MSEKFRLNPDLSVLSLQAPNGDTAKILRLCPFRNRLRIKCGPHAPIPAPKYFHLFSDLALPSYLPLPPEPVPQSALICSRTKQLIVHTVHEIGKFGITMQTLIFIAYFNRNKLHSAVWHLPVTF